MFFDKGDVFNGPVQVTGVVALHERVHFSGMSEVFSSVLPANSCDDLVVGDDYNSVLVDY